MEKKMKKSEIKEKLKVIIKINIDLKLLVLREILLKDENLLIENRLCKKLKVSIVLICTKVMLVKKDKIKIFNF